ncbi:MAG TPA: hypothetical protein VD999_06030 [Vitreimonas sp.]|nr:hypothetical protein [Vitreimonas sp.]
MINEVNRQPVTQEHESTESGFLGQLSGKIAERFGLLAPEVMGIVSALVIKNTEFQEFNSEAMAYVVLGLFTLASVQYAEIKAGREKDDLSFKDYAFRMVTALGAAVFTAVGGLEFTANQVSTAIPNISNQDLRELAAQIPRPNLEVLKNIDLPSLSDLPSPDITPSREQLAKVAEYIYNAKVPLLSLTGLSFLGYNMQEDKPIGKVARAAWRGTKAVGRGMGTVTKTGLGIAGSVINTGIEGAKAVHSGYKRSKEAIKSLKNLRVRVEWKNDNDQAIDLNRWSR